MYGNWPQAVLCPIVCIPLASWPQRVSDRRNITTLTQTLSSPAFPPAIARYRLRLSSIRRLSMMLLPFRYAIIIIIIIIIISSSSSSSLCIIILIAFDIVRPEHVGIESSTRSNQLLRTTPETVRTAALQVVIVVSFIITVVIVGLGQVSRSEVSRAPAGGEDIVVIITVIHYCHHYHYYHYYYRYISIILLLLLLLLLSLPLLTKAAGRLRGGGERSGQGLHCFGTYV